MKARGFIYRLKRYICFVFVLFALQSCVTTDKLAPVGAAIYDSSQIKKANYIQKKQVHFVGKGETLYAIAFRYDKDYNLLAQYNHLSHPYILHIGQKLYVPAKWPASSTKKVVTTKVPINKSVRAKKSVKVRKKRWRMPAKGKIITYFNLKKGRKGIDIKGKIYQSVVASNDGQVAYSGNGLHGYGNLIIIRHSQTYLSAYAHNKKNLVEEGSWVKAGQKIAEMGINGGKYSLHFEIRRSGKPINPLSLIHRRIM